MGNWTYLVNGIMQRPDRSQTSLEKIILEKSSNAKRHLPFPQDGAEFFYRAQNCHEHLWTWKLLNLTSIFSGSLIKGHSLYSFFLSMFFLLSPQHSATPWSSFHFTKCRSFIFQQNFCSAAWLWVIFVLALLFTRLWLLFWCKSKGANGIFITWLWVLWTSSSVDFPLQQLLPLAWTGFSRCYWD